MSTTMRTSAVINRGEPLSRRRPTTIRPDSGRIVGFFRWAAARPLLTVATLVLVYLATLAAVVAVLTVSAASTVIGAAVMVLFGAEVIVHVAIVIYCIIPEQTPSAATA